MTFLRAQRLVLFLSLKLITWLLIKKNWFNYKNFNEETEDFLDKQIHE